MYESNQLSLADRAPAAAFGLELSHEEILGDLHFPHALPGWWDLEEEPAPARARGSRGLTASLR